jgi:tRNA dimethylallyltransferase
MTVRLLVVAGPTAVGKTRLAVEIAHSLGSEILSADSRQVYRGLDLGTGKDLEEYSAVDPAVPYHLIDIADPDEIYTLFRFQQDCYRVIHRLIHHDRLRSGAVPLIMAGGSGLYVEAIIKDYRITDVPGNPELRRLIGGRHLNDLGDQLRKSDPERAGRTDLSNKERVIRALEIVEAASRGPVPTSEPLGLELDCRVYVIRLDREILRRRIRSRLESRMAEGMVDEVRGLLDAGLSHHRLERLGLEYREVGAYLAGRKNRFQLVDDLATAIGRFAKRQETWFRGMEKRGTPITWIKPGDAGRILADVKEWVAGSG